MAENTVESLQRKTINDEQDYLLKKLKLINDADKEFMQKECDQERQRRLLTEQVLEDSVKVTDCLKTEIQKNKELLSSAEAAFTQYLDKSS